MMSEQTPGAGVNGAEAAQPVTLEQMTQTCGEAFRAIIDAAGMAADGRYAEAATSALGAWTSCTGAVANWVATLPASWGTGSA
jgi:hypothetical protein